MKQQNLPSSLPFLPGNSYADPTITRYHKTQLLGVTNGVITEKTSYLKEDVSAEMVQTMMNSVSQAGRTMQQRAVQENDGIPKIAPKWLKHDRQVLNFKCYFQEPVVENPTENFRVRKCILYLYLEDDTIHIIETRVENAGIPQGVFLKRHKLPVQGKQDCTHTWQDLKLGMNLNVYGRVFRIVDCDDFTHRFYADQGCDIGRAEPFPEDTFATTRQMINFKQNPPDLAEHKNYIEVMLKGGRPNKNLESFIANDRNVLSFSIRWNDTSYDGGEKFYTLNYFLSDKSVEVKEINKLNDGRYPFPMLLKRQKLAKVPILTHCPGMSLRTEDYYMPEDLRIGENIVIFGRTCQIYDCDASTRIWYKQHLGYDQQSIAVKGVAANLLYKQIPPYMGYGIEEDSMGSVIALQPKRPKADMKKMFKQDMHILRFNSKLVSTEPDDESRGFIISFYCGDDTIQVYEVCDKNSGRIGGKFMERKKHKNPVTSTYYAEKDFLIGRTVFLGGFKFQLVSADEYTEKYMEDNPDCFPESSMEYIISKIKKPAAKFPDLQTYVIELLKFLDKDQNGVISFEEFTAGLRNMGINVTHHEEHVLMRCFDHNGDGAISMEEFYNTLAAQC